MGCDGGTIPRRDELVRVKKKPELKDKDAELAFYWRCCAITQEQLQEPIVVCHLGKLYSKTSLIEALLDRSLLPEGSSHIKTLKDVRDLNLTDNPEYKADEHKAEGAIDHRASPYICPVLRLEMNGKYRFVALWSCGCVFSERAYKEIRTSLCHKCARPFDDEDVVIINGTTDDLDLMKVRMEVRRTKNKKGKKIKKPKIEPVETEAVASNGLDKDGTLVETDLSLKNPAIKRFNMNGEFDQSVKKIRTIGNVISTGKVSTQEELRKMKPEYSIANDGKATDVYKSLFTTHKSEQDQERAHWVTYNPFYN